MDEVANKSKINDWLTVTTLFDKLNKQLEKTMLEFNEQGFNVALYWENDSPEDTLSLVPTSAITGEGLSDLITDLCNMG